MALDRTWYNALVDDDGSGLTGSVWDKADVDALMDAVDAEIARIDAPPGAFWTPTLIGTGGGTGVYSLQQAWWERRGALTWVGGQLTLSGKGSLSGALALSNLPRGANTVIAQAGPHVGNFAGINASSVGMYAAAGAGTFMYLTYVPAAGGVSAFIDASFITVPFTLIFGGTYLS